MSDKYYKTLGLEKNCSDEDIKKAYRKLAMVWHPDKHVTSSPEKQKIAEDKFKEINNAYEILSNKEKREMYDRTGDFNFNGNMGGFQFNDAHDVFKNFFGEGFNIHTFDPFGNMGFNQFGNNGRVEINVNGKRTSFFNGRPMNQNSQQNFHQQFANFQSHFKPHPNSHSHSHFQSRQNFNEKKKDDPIFVDVNVSLEELYKGTNKRRKITRQIVDAKRSKQIESEIVSFDVMPGWKEGTKITFRNKGDVNDPNIEPADIIFVVKEKPHNVFVRDGNNLIATIEIDSKDLAKLNEDILKKTVTLLDGKQIEIVIEEIMLENNYTHKIVGKGMPIRKAGQCIGYGDLLIKFKIQV